MELRGAVGILTGASRGVGAVLAEHLARRGVHLALAARSAEGLQETAERVIRNGVRAAAIPTDVTDAAALEELVRRVEIELGPVDLLVNNAGIEHYSRYERIDPATIEVLIATNLTAAALLTRLVLPSMVARGRGHVVNISSAAGKTATPFNTVYSSTKHALVGFTWSLREEMKPLGIGVSVVCPGFISRTGMFAARTRGRKPPAVAATVTPEEVAAATIRAIERNRAEVIVSGALGKVVDVFAALSVDGTAAGARRAGLYRFLEGEADRSSG